MYNINKIYTSISSRDFYIVVVKRLVLEWIQCCLIGPLDRSFFRLYPPGQGLKQRSVTRAVTKGNHATETTLGFPVLASNDEHSKTAELEEWSHVRVPVDLVVPGNTFLHDDQQVVVRVSTVDQQRLPHGHSQPELPLKHLGEPR